MVTCRRGSRGAVLRKEQCRHLLQSIGRGHIKRRGGAEEYSRAEGGGITERDSALRGYTAEERCMVLGKARNEEVLQSGGRGTGVGGRVGMRRDAVRKSGSGVASRCSAALRAEGLCGIEVVSLSSPPKHMRAERLRLPSRLWLMCMRTTKLR